MYFATLTEIPIVQGLLNSGMGKGPALALLLAGPALSLPSMLVIRSVIGTQKTIVQLKEPFVPHWVAFYGNEKLLFSSEMFFNGETPKPNLILSTSSNEKISIWKK